MSEAPEDPGLPATPALPAVILLEGVAFSLAAARGAWFPFGVLAALLGLAACVSGRTRWIQLRVGLAVMAAVLVLHPVLSGLQLLVAAAWWWPGRRRLYVAAVLAGLAAPFLEDLPRSPIAEGEDLVTVVSWNVGMRRAEDWEFHLLHHFRRTPADVIVLQEIAWSENRPGFEHWKALRERDREATMRLAEFLGLSYHFSDTPLGQRPRPYQSGTVVLSRHPFGPLGDRAEGLPPAFLVEAPQGRFVLSPFHLWSPPFASRAERREGLERLFSSLPAGIPRVVLGDTNLAPMDRADLPARHGFRDAAWSSWFFGGTWPSGLPIARLDAAFLSGDLDVVTCRVLGSRASDHRPVLIQFRPRAPAQESALAGGSPGTS